MPDLRGVEREHGVEVLFFGIPELNVDCLWHVVWIESVSDRISRWSAGWGISEQLQLSFREQRGILLDQARDSRYGRNDNRWIFLEDHHVTGRVFFVTWIKTSSATDSLGCPVNHFRQTTTTESGGAES
jgi:hypothetical protein